MKKKLLFTTALVALVCTSNVYAADLSIQAGDNIFNPATGQPDGQTTYNYDSISMTGGKLTLEDFKIRSNSDASITGGEINISGDGGLRAHNGNLNISGGTINASATEIHGGITNVSGNAIINVNDYAEFAGDSELNMSGGQLNLSKGITIVSLPDQQTGGDALFNMTGGEINMSQSYLGSSRIEGTSITERQAGTSKLLGGTINVKDGKNIFLMDNPEVNNTININEGAELGVYDHYIDARTGKIEDINFAGKSTLNLSEKAEINISGKLVSDVSGNGNLNVKSSSALIDGNVSGSNLTFEADHSLSKAFSGTIGDLASLNVNKGTLTYDKQTGKIGNLNVTGGLDIGTNTVNATNVDFKDNSSLALRVAATDNYGKINADNITIGKDTTMKVTLDNGVVGNGENTDLKFLNGKVTGSFTNKIAENSRYDIKWNEDGSLNITGTATASDVVTDAGGTTSNAATAEAWDTLVQSTTASANAKAVASVLNDLSQETSAAGKKAYVDALTAVAPEVAPMVQKTQTETANQVFGAVSTRLTGGSISTGSEGMSSGDSNPDAAVWVQGLFNKSKLDDTSKAKGFDADSSGIAFGAEKFVNDDVKVGVGYAYTNTDIDGFMRSTDVDTHTAIVYSEYKPSNWYVNGIATYGWSDYSEDKNVNGIGVKADYDVETFGLQAMTGYDMQVKGFGLTPEVGLRYVHIKQDAYKDSADQKVSGNDSDILTGVIGAKVSKNFELSNGMNIKPEARVAATYDLFNDDVNSVVTLTNGSAYAVEGEALDRFGMEFGAGVTAELNSQVELSLGYEGKFREDYQDHTGLLNAKYKF